MIRKLLCFFGFHKRRDYWEWYERAGYKLQSEPCETSADLQRWMYDLNRSQIIYLTTCKHCKRRL